MDAEVRLPEDGYLAVGVFAIVGVGHRVVVNARVVTMRRRFAGIEKRPCMRLYDDIHAGVSRGACMRLYENASY
jgi:hypothetical protein